MVMTPRLPTTAAERYERLRRQALQGGGRRDAFAVLLYHGMYYGLAQLMGASDPQRPPVPAPAPPADNALIRQVANMILHLQAELTPVY
jgi:hypothetical protein